MIHDRHRPPTPERSDLISLAIFAAIITAIFFAMLIFAPGGTP